MLRILPLFLLTAGPAFAACSSADASFLWCRIAGSPKTLEVCAEWNGVAYRFGPQGRPELELFETYAGLDYQPWPGVGMDIWENVTFYNGDYSYVVNGGVERQYDSYGSERSFGGVTVSKGGREIAWLECDRNAVTYNYGDALMNGKARAGYQWDPGSGWFH